MNDLRKRSSANQRSAGGRRTASTLSLIGALALVGCVLIVNYFFPGAIPSPGAPTASASQTPAPDNTPSSDGAPTRAPTLSAPAGGLPNMPNKPTPRQITFKGCPPEGDGGDAELNRLKNRVDEGNYAPVTFDAILDLKWPSSIEQRFRNRWSAADRAAIAHYEGIPVVVEGFWAGARLSGPESPNCHGEAAEFRDYHVWLTKTAGEDRTRSIVIEPTPRVKANHAGWRSDVFERVVRERLRTRISGWLMMDPEHPVEIGKTRGTIWEVHPIMQIEVQQGGRWVTLDDFAR